VSDAPMKLPPAVRPSLRACCTAFAAVAAVGLLASATAQASIVVGKSIDGIKLGETEAQVTQALGVPAYKTPEGSETSWGYPKTLEGRVGFKSGHVVGMWTASKSQKTNKGIGPGSKVAAVKRAYPAAKCSAGPFGPQSLICTLKSKYHGRTVETTFPFFSRSAGAREVDVDFG
jgi:hypothetical protein